MSNVLQRQAEALLHEAVAALIKTFQRLVVTPSAWEWYTSASASVTAGTPALKFSVGGTGGAIFLMRDGAGATRDERWKSKTVKRVHMAYGGVGVGVGVAVPQPWLLQVSPSVSASSWWNNGALYIISGSDDYATPETFNEPEVGLAPFVIIGLDGGLMGALRYASPAFTALPHADALDHQIGGSVAMMFMGINQAIYARVRDFFKLLGDLRVLAGHKPPPGFLAGIVDSVRMQAAMDWDLVKMSADVFALISQMSNMFYRARSVLVSAGVEQVGWPGVGVTVFGGLFRGATNVGTGAGESILDKLPKPAFAG